MRVFLPPSEDHRKVASSKKSHSHHHQQQSSSSSSSSEEQQQQQQHQPPPCKKKKGDQCKPSSSSSSSALPFSSGDTTRMCPPSLKRGDSVDGDDKNKINNLNLLGGEEPQQQQPLHHHGIDDIAISSTSNNFTATSSNTVKMGTSMRSYDEFNNGRFWKSNDYEDNLTNDHAGDEDTGLRVSHAAAASAASAHLMTSTTETINSPGHSCKTATSAMENPADDDSECRGKDSDDECVVPESLSRTIYLGKSHVDTRDHGDGNTRNLMGNTGNHHSRGRSCRNQATRRSSSSSPSPSVPIMQSSSDSASGQAPAPLLNHPIPGSRDDPATMSKSDAYYGVMNEHRTAINSNNDDDDSLSTVSRFIHLLRTQHKPSLDIVPMDGDGNCLFRAISLQVYGDATMHMDVRRDCLDYMERDAEHFHDFVIYDGHEEFTEYVARKRRNGVHGNHAEIQAMSELYNRTIEVYVPDHGIEPINIFHSEYKGVGDAPIRLCYMDGNHYDAVIDPLLPTAGLGLCLPGLQPGLADKLQLEEAKKKSSESALEEKMRLALEESQRTIKEREEMEMRVALRKSCEFTTTVDSDDDLYKKKAMYLSEIEAAEFDLEQAVLASSLESYQKAEQERKLPSLRRIEGRRSRFNSSPRSLRASSNSPVNNTTNATVAMNPSSYQYAASAAVASLPSSASAEASRSTITTDEYPACVQELVMNGFELTKVVHAYELIGDNFDDLLSFLLSSMTT